jgi:hypothetical protein
MSISWEIPRLSLLNINDMYILFATNTVKNCLYLASKVKNEKSNTVNRYGIRLAAIGDQVPGPITIDYINSLPAFFLIPPAVYN